ncbi:lipocalin-like domain-containing protein [Granulicella arctica]|uniref:lipocalin-like domain-containing protein n=1 Tax=Granulicella arctica TaxID=940613 RepID=UPI0037BF9481
MSTDSVLAARKPFVGVWTLESFTETTGSSEEVSPLGNAPLGFLIYTAEGFVSAQLMRRDREAVGSDPWAGEKSDEGADLTTGYIAYCGRYEVDESNSEVLHIPIVALLPNLVDREQHRSFKFEGRTLTLVIMQATSTGVMIKSRLVWNRPPQNASGSDSLPYV